MTDSLGYAWSSQRFKTHGRIQFWVILKYPFSRFGGSESNLSRTNRIATVNQNPLCCEVWYIGPTRLKLINSIRKYSQVVMLNNAPILFKVANSCDPVFDGWQSLTIHASKHFFYGDSFSTFTLQASRNLLAPNYTVRYRNNKTRIGKTQQKDPSID